MLSKEEKVKYTAMMAQYRSEIQALAYKLEKLDEEMEIIFPYECIIDAVYHLEDAEKILSNLMKDINCEKEENYFDS